ncbi:MAG: formylmethanofuran--tetrahydromethanopterin N-formyltransferase [Pirellulaceae bacterium]
MMQIGSTLIKDTFAEAFRMQFCRLGITAQDEYWLEAALKEFCGYATSVIGCDAEIGIEQRFGAAETPDGRAGAACLVFGFSSEALEKAIVNRVGQCVMTCPTSAVFDASAWSQSPLPEATDKVVSIGRQLRFFGDGYQKSKLIRDRRFWRIPVMDGEFLVEESARVFKGVAGGNFLIESADQETGLAALRRAIDAINLVPGTILPFPGGGVRSGSKVGSKYKGLKATTSDRHCPTLKGRVDSDLCETTNCVYEIVIDGIDEHHVAMAMKQGIEAAIGNGVVAINAGNYGGKLGKFHFRLHDVMNDKAAENAQ